jgi:hypothetical protein
VLVGKMVAVQEECGRITASAAGAMALMGEGR